MKHIVIIGAGAAGCTAAIALAPNHRVTLIDRRDRAPDRIGENLPPASGRILKRLELLREFTSQDHLPSRGMRSYWSSDSARYVDSLCNPDGSGWFLNRRAFENFLRKKAQERGVSCCWPARLASAAEEDERWHVVTDNGLQFEADFVIDAGGRQSPFLRAIGHKRTQVDKLVSCWITLPDNSEDRMGTIASTQHGWFYSAPLPGRRRVMSFQSDTDLIDIGLKRDLNRFLENAEKCRPMADIINSADVSQAAHCGVTAANSTCHPLVAGRNWAALGDAAISFDPLSSQGLFNAMASAIQLADLINGGRNIEQEYGYQISNIWRHYLSHKQIFYSVEKRWLNAAFWRRRVAPSPRPFAAAPDPLPTT